MDMELLWESIELGLMGYGGIFIAMLVIYAASVLLLKMFPGEE